MTRRVKLPPELGAPIRETTMTDRPCRKDDPTWPFPCSCDDCSRAAAAAWRTDMDRVLSGEMSLAEAQRRAEITI